MKSPAWWAVRLRRVGYRILFLWFDLLRYQAEKWVKSAPPGFLAGPARREQLHRVKRRFQGQLGQLFIPYHGFCAGCLWNCCKGETAKGIGRQHLVDALDSLLYPIPYEVIDHFSRWHRPRQDEDFDSMEREKPPCPAFRGEGCHLPYGERPAICVVHVCGTYLRALYWRDYFRLVATLSGYFAGLTFCLLTMRPEYQRLKTPGICRPKNFPAAAPGPVEPRCPCTPEKG